MDKMVTLSEAAKLLGASKATLRNWDKAGKLTAVRHPMNGYRLFSLAQLREVTGQMELIAPPETAQPQAVPLDARSIRRLVGRLHDILRDTDGQSTIVSRFDEITKVLFTKAMLDREATALASENAAPSAGPEQECQEIRTHYARLAAKHRNIVPNRFCQLSLSDQALSACLEALRGFDLSANDIDVKGIAYEEVIRKTFDKGDHQQFFTPHHVVDFITDACLPMVHGDVCDPAAGTGGFLAAVARKSQHYASLTAIEIDERLSWVAGINMLLHAAHGIRTVHLSQGGTLGLGALDFRSSFDAILTNPPFGSDFSDAPSLQLLALGRNRSSRRRGILFIERCHDLLRPAGTIAIIIDEGVLTLPHALDVRQFILDHFVLRGVVCLPETAFMPYATVNASILIMNKRLDVCEPQPAVFFARAGSVGRKPSGDEDIRFDRNGQSYLHSDLPSILDAWHSWRRDAILPLSGPAYVANIANGISDHGSGLRLDFQYHNPSRQKTRGRLASCAYPLVSLREICVERSDTLIPSQALQDQVIRYTGLANIEAGTGRLDWEMVPANALRSQVKRYQPGDILFAKMRPTLRKVAFVEGQDPGFVSAECCVLVPLGDESGAPRIDPLLLSVLLRSDLVFDQIAHLIAGIGRPRVSAKELLQVQVPLPPAPVQTRLRERYEASMQQNADFRAQAQELLGQADKCLSRSLDWLAAAALGGPSHEE